MPIKDNILSKKFEHNTKKWINTTTKFYSHKLLLANFHLAKQCLIKLSKSYYDAIKLHFVYSVVGFFKGPYQQVSKINSFTTKHPKYRKQLSIHRYITLVVAT